MIIKEVKHFTEKTSNVVPFFGDCRKHTWKRKAGAEHYLRVPDKYDAVISTLTLHHCLDITKVFEGISDALGENGKAVIVDLCKQSIEEFRKEMCDVHLGLNPSLVRKLTEKFFSDVCVKKNTWNLLRTLRQVNRTLRNGSETLARSLETTLYH